MSRLHDVEELRFNMMREVTSGCVVWLMSFTEFRGTRWQTPRRFAHKIQLGLRRGARALDWADALTRDRPPGYSHGSNRPLAAVPE